MIYETSIGAVAVFLVFVLGVVGLSAFLGRKAKSAGAYFAAHGEIHWFVNGVAFAGDYLSAASFLGICGMIAFYGYDGFLYSIGYLAGWIVALFVVAEPLKRMGRYTFADALNNQFQDRGIKLAASISTLVVSIFYLIPQMVGAGTLVQPLLGLSHAAGVVVVGVVVMTIVVTAGMVSTTYVQFFKGAMLVVLCAGLTVLVLNRGLSINPHDPTATMPLFAERPLADVLKDPARVIPATGPWEGKPYVRLKKQDETSGFEIFRIDAAAGTARSAQAVSMAEGKKLIGGVPQGTIVNGTKMDLLPGGHVENLPGGVHSTGPLGPLGYLSTLQQSTVVTWASEKIVDPEAGPTTVYYAKPVAGAELLVPGGSPTFKGIRGDGWREKLDFVSLMLALFGGTASLPHILIRYYTVKDQASARKSTVVGIASIGFFYILTLYLGLGAMTSGRLDVTNSNMAAPLLARSFGELPFAIISAVAFTTVLGTVSGLILAASGAVAHDLAGDVFRMPLSDSAKVRLAKWAAVVVGVIAMILGIVFEKMNVSFLVGWAFNIAASANLPALVMLLFWRRTTRQGIVASISVGMLSSLGWILVSQQAFKDVYGLPPEMALVPFSQPGLVTIPLGFAVLAVVSELTQPKRAKLAV